MIKTVVNIYARSERRQTFTFFSSQVNIDEILWIVFASAILTLLFDYPFSNLKKLIFDSKRTPTPVSEKTKLDINANEPKSSKVE